MCGNIFEDPENQGFPYIMASDDYEVDDEGYPINADDYMTCYAYSNDGAVTKISRVFTDQTDTILASYIAYQDRYVMGSDYYACICTCGYTEEYEYNMWYYLILQFNEIAKPSDVEEIQENPSPVEYYNLEGVRVNDPSNGIFIRKQGPDVKKIIVRK